MQWTIPLVNPASIFAVVVVIFSALGCLGWLVNHAAP
jgi:hypothetical protein